MKKDSMEREPFGEGFFINKNMIIIWDEITDALARNVVLAITYLDITLREEYANGGEEQDIIIIICSPGGDVSAGFSIYDAMNNAKCDVQTICYGKAMSMGAFLLSSGTRGKRYALPNATIMIHQPLGGAQGQATDIEIRAREIVRIRSRLNYILAHNTGKSIEEISVATERDNFMSAEEALEFGLIDKIIDFVPKAFEKPVFEEV